MGNDFEKFDIICAPEPFRPERIAKTLGCPPKTIMREIVNRLVFKENHRTFSEINKSGTQKRSPAAK